MRPIAAIERWENEGGALREVPLGRPAPDASAPTTLARAIPSDRRGSELPELRPNAHGDAHGQAQVPGVHPLAGRGGRVSAQLEEPPAVRPGAPLRLDEPNLALPTGAILFVSVVVPAIIAGVWTLAGWIAGNPVWPIAGLAGAAVVALSAILSTLATVPWIPKPASTAGLAWMAGSALRGMLSIAGGLLLYSAPPFGWSEDLAKGASPLLFAVATAWFVALLAEVAVIARHVLRANP